MYESSCSYQSALDLKRVSSCNIKSEDCMGGDWAGCAYRFSTFEQLKQSVEKAKAALQDRGGYSAFSDLATSPFCAPPPPPPPDPDKRPHGEYYHREVDFEKKTEALQDRGGYSAFRDLAT